jgi:sugar phosphate isomerase/epimerase
VVKYLYFHDWQQLLYVSFSARLGGGQAQFALAALFIDFLPSHSRNMIKSAVTISLVPELRGGPWVLWDDLVSSCRKAAKHGFDGVELFTRDDSVPGLGASLEETGLGLAAVGTGAGKVLHGLTLIDPDPSKRQQARVFVKSMVKFGAKYNAPAIIGSMQGVHGGNREDSLKLLADSLEELGEYAESQEVPIIYEPLNRYETNLFNRLAEAAEFVDNLNTNAVFLLADLFHMNIEEEDIAQSIKDAASVIGHVHFADTNRRPVGLGHLEVGSVASALKGIGYSGYVSAEAFDFPNPDKAAGQTIHSFRKYFRD